MKVSTALFLFIYSFPVLANKKIYPITSMELTSREGVFSLMSLRRHEAIRLDCNSFIHEWVVYRSSEVYDRIPLSERECVELFQVIRTGLERAPSVCIIYDMQRFVFRYSKLCPSPHKKIVK